MSTITPEFNKYPKIANFDEVIFIAQQAYELGFRGGTGRELYSWLQTRLDLTRLSNTAGLPEDFPEPNSQLTAQNKGEWTILTPGTYQKQTTGEIVVPQNQFAFAQFDGTDYNVVKFVEMPEQDISGLATKDDIANIKDELTPKLQIGALEPGGGNVLSPNYTRIMLNAAEKDSTIRKVSFIYSSGSVNNLLVKVFNKTSDGVPEVGSAFEQVGNDTIIVPYSGLNQHNVNIPIQNGQYIGFYCLSGITSRPGAGLFGSPHQTGDLEDVTLQHVYDNIEIQICFELFDESTTRIDVIEEELAGISPSTITIVPDVPELPEPSYGKSALIPVFDKGAAWSDGKVWRWYKDNQPVEISWNHVLGLAQQDGWKVVFGLDNPYKISVDGSDVELLEDGLGSYPNIENGSSAPELVSFIENGPSAAQFIGSERLSSEEVSSRDIPLFIMTAYSYAGATTGSTDYFLMDGRTVSERLAIHAVNGSIRVFSASDTIVAPLDNLPHITGVEMNGSVSGRIYHDSVFSTTHLTKTAFAFGIIGADYQGARGWNGKLAALLVYEGKISTEKIHRMNSVLSMYYGVSKGNRTISADAYSTMSLSNKSVVVNHNGKKVYNIASVTKLMTLAVASEYITDYNEMVTIKASDVTSPIEGFVKDGDVVSIKDLFAAALIVSDNNAPIAISRIAGYIINPSAVDDVQAKSTFITTMNDKAIELGMSNTTYSLPWTNGMSTSDDQLKLLAHIQENITEIKELWGLLDYTVTVSGINARTYVINNSVGLNTRGLLPEFIGGKTGTVDNRGSFAFVWSSESGLNATVVLRSFPNTERYIDSRLVLDNFINKKL